MTLLVTGVIFGGLLSGYCFGLLVLCVALFIFAAGSDQFGSGQFSAMHALVFSSLCLAPFFAAQLSAQLLERAMLTEFRGKGFTALFLGAVMTLLFEAGIFLDFVEAAFKSLASISVLKLIPLEIALINSVIFCGALLALVFMLAILSLELPIAWLLHATRSRVMLQLKALRPVLVLLLFTFTINLFLPLFVSELSPTSLINSIGGAK